MIPTAEFLPSADYLNYHFIIHTKGAQTEGAGEAAPLNFVQWLLSKELYYCHHPEAHNFEVVSRFVQSLVHPCSIL